MKFSDQVSVWLKESGYTTCFFVAGGNSMHLLNSFRGFFNCVPVVHEVTAVIAAEYFNQHSVSGQAFVLVTAGPGLTNSITGIAGAWLESHSVLIIGGQVKTADLATETLRQRGIQEIGGAQLVRTITKTSTTLHRPIDKATFLNLINEVNGLRPGPVFIEVCLDVQGAPAIDASVSDEAVLPAEKLKIPPDQLLRVQALVRESKRPLLLLGGGVPRVWAQKHLSLLETLGLPIQLTWNGADRYASDRPFWFGRPDTWGMRFANVILQQSDLAIVVGARLGLQQTGFNWHQFVPNGTIVHVCNDEAELQKGHPFTHEKILGDSADFLTWLSTVVTSQFDEWLDYCTEIKRALPLSDSENSSHPGFHNPYDFVLQLSRVCRNTDRVVPCSSGGANTVMMQSFMNKTGQIFFNNRALASMGYGLAGAIGAALSEPRRRTVLVEGDGGFAQNVQDLGTAAINRLNLKIFIFENQGYASIRMTQRNYFNGAYVGCDETTGLGFPIWDKLADAYSIPSLLLPIEFLDSPDFLSLWNMDGPALFRVQIHPEQTYFPKISSQIAKNGSMESAPLHLMTPKLSEDLAERVMRYI